MFKSILGGEEGGYGVILVLSVQCVTLGQFLCLIFSLSVNVRFKA